VLEYFFVQLNLLSNVFLNGLKKVTQYKELEVLPFQNEFSYPMLENVHVNLFDFCKVKFT